MCGKDILCGISKGTFEILHKISYPYIERCGFHSQVKIYELLDLRAYCFWNTPWRCTSVAGIASYCVVHCAMILGLKYLLDISLEVAVFAMCTYPSQIGSAVQISTNMIYCHPLVLRQCLQKWWHPVGGLLLLIMVVCTSIGYPMRKKFRICQ